ncbi:phosphatidate cytidylyltransferase [Oceanibium sediminis]|uniref:phosphatidate cytidylyltransferase n=1 Tax=Oceanibium sediminis TaxID=2026339 RepID=UPI000DD2CE45|nr:phosphatidate cytidylyltransferase [Oceanibium sediminis]
MSWLERIAPAPVGPALAVIFAVLIAASVLVAIIARRRPCASSDELALRVRSWWFMISIFALAIVLSPVVSTVFLGFVSFLAFKEFISLIPTRRVDRVVLFFAYLSIPAQFTFAHLDWYGMFVVFIPVWGVLFLAMLMVLRGQTDGFLRAIGTYSWGLLITVFALSHTAMLLAGGQAWNPGGGGAGLLLFLVGLTQFNDVAQFTWGKLLGRRKIIPAVSPGKTVEGFLGGVATTALVAALVGPYLTGMDWPWSLVAGAMIAVAGFVGDVTISALKRDLGVKDSGGLIPGHGGILDRVDSLTYTAPVFLHFYRFFFVG